MFKKFIFSIFILLIVLTIAYLYLLINSRTKYPVEYGISFNRQHAESLGLVWQKVYVEMLDELQPKYIRLAANWSETELQPSVYNSAEVDWQMAEAEKRGVKVVLVVGQKAPRWPECHVPDWTADLSPEEYSGALFKYIEYVVERYKTHPALEIWQVENEPFIRFRFGECEGFRVDLVKQEIALVRLLDPNHKILITDSGELATWRRASRAGDIFGTTLYRIVRTPSGKIWTYDWLPASFYRLKAQFWNINPNNMFVAELQAEPWFSSSDPSNTSIEEQEQTMNIERIKKHFDYTERIGVPRAYLWGVEWWYWMKEKHGDGRYWDLVKNKLNI